MVVLQKPQRFIRHIPGYIKCSTLRLEHDNHQFAGDIQNDSSFMKNEYFDLRGN